MGGTTTSLLHTPPWLAQEKLCFTIYITMLSVPKISELNQ